MIGRTCTIIWTISRDRGIWWRRWKTKDRYRKSSGWRNKMIDDSNDVLLYIQLYFNSIIVLRTLMWSSFPKTSSFPTPSKTCSRRPQPPTRKTYISLFVLLNEPVYCFFLQLLYIFCVVLSFVIGSILQHHRHKIVFIFRKRNRSRYHLSQSFPCRRLILSSNSPKGTCSKWA